MAKSVLIRVSAETKAELDAVIEQLLRANEEGKLDVGSDNNNPAHRGVSYDQAVKVLLAERRGRKQRQRASRAKKKAGG